MSAQPGFTESHSPLPREEILARTVRDLHLNLRGTRLESLVERLHGELGKAGLVFRPPVYLSDDWGCPDLVPIIGVPFYLADAQLTRLHDELMEGVEAETDDEIMRYLRHEAGHAFNYAYRLFESPEWTALFGPFSRPYPDQYTPNPFSRSFVRHLPAWYAQKHPDEDFAETFAVWLDPNSNWRVVYADWPCLSKLLYVEGAMGRLGAAPPPVTAADYNVTEEEFLRTPIGRLYERATAPRRAIPLFFDAPLRDIFGGPPGSEPAAEWLRRHRRALVWSVYYWTGLDDAVVRDLLDHFEERCRTLALRVEPNPDESLIDATAFVTTLCMNHLQTGEFVRK